MTKTVDFIFDVQLFAEGSDVEDTSTSGTESEDQTQEDESVTKETETHQEPKGEMGGTLLGGKQDTSITTAPDTYDFRDIVPAGMEYDEGAAAAFSEVAKAAGLTQEQASTIAQHGMEYMRQGVEAAMGAIHATQVAWAEQSKQELGASFQETVAKAAAARDVLATKIPGITAMLNETGAGNRVEMIRLMAAVSELLGEDNGDRSGVGGVEKSIYPNTDFKKYN